MSVHPPPGIRVTAMPGGSATGAVEIDLITLPTTRTFDGAVSLSVVPSKIRTFSNRTAAGCTFCACATVDAAHSRPPSAADRPLELMRIAPPLLLLCAHRDRWRPRMLQGRAGDYIESATSWDSSPPGRAMTSPMRSSRRSAAERHCPLSGNRRRPAIRRKVGDVRVGSMTANRPCPEARRRLSGRRAAGRRSPNPTRPIAERIAAPAAPLAQS